MFRHSALAFALTLSACLDTALPTPSPAGQTDAGPPWCFVLPEVVDFGEVEIDSVGLRRFSITNSSPERQRLTLGVVDAPFTAALPRELVPPGTDAEILLTFVASDGLARVSRFTFTGGNGCPEQRVELRALGGGSLTATNFIDFGPLEFNTPATRSLRLFNTRRFAVEVDLRDADPNSRFVLTPSHVTVPATGSIDVQIGFTATAPGAAGTSLTVESSAGDRLSVTLLAMGGLPIASFSPARYDITRMPIDEGLSRMIAVSNSGVGALQIKGIRVVQADGGPSTEALSFAFESFIQPDASVEFQVLLSPRTAGPRWVAEISTSDPVRPTLSVPIHGVAEDIEDCSMTFTVPRNLSFPSPMTSADVEIGFDNTLGSVDCLVDDPRIQDGVIDFGAPLVLEPEQQFVVPAGTRGRRTLRVTQSGFFNFVYHPIGLGTQVTFVEVQ